MQGNRIEQVHFLLVEEFVQQTQWFFLQQFFWLQGVCEDVDAIPVFGAVVLTARAVACNRQGLQEKACNALRRYMQAETRG